MSDDLKKWILQEVDNISFGPGEVVIQTEHFIAFPEKPVT
jgi:hypothetical protein